MKSYKTILIAIALIIMSNFFVPQIMGFFDISPSSYITYVHWFTMIGVFFLVLPSSKSSIFS